MKRLDTKVKRYMKGWYQTNELEVLISEKGYNILLRHNPDLEGYELAEGIEDITFPNLNNFKSWLRFWANKPEQILKKK